MNAGIKLQFQLGDKVIHHSGDWRGQLVGLGMEPEALVGEVVLDQPIVIDGAEENRLKIWRQTVPLQDLRPVRQCAGNDDQIYEIACSMAQELQELLDVGQSEHPERYETTRLILEDWHRVNRDKFGIPAPAEGIPGQDDLVEVAGIEPGERRLFFNQLSAAQQHYAAASFFDAGPDDGCLYELGTDGQVLCRRRVA